MSELRTCNRCGETDLLVNYPKRSQKIGGYQLWCKPCSSKYQAEWYAKNREKKLEKSKQDYNKSRLERKVTRARYYQNNKLKVKENVIAYVEKNPLMRRVASANRRARLLGRGKHTVKEALNLFDEQFALCANIYCLADLRVVKKNLDHKTPLHKGGSNTIENMQWLCEACNLEKTTLSFDDWTGYLRWRYTGAQLCPR